jgi:hypothetical protein
LIILISVGFAKSATVELNKLDQKDEYSLGDTSKIEINITSDKDVAYIDQIKITPEELMIDKIIKTSGFLNNKTYDNNFQGLVDNPSRNGSMIISLKSDLKNRYHIRVESVRIRDDQDTIIPITNSLPSIDLIWTAPAEQTVSQGPSTFILPSGTESEGKEPVVMQLTDAKEVFKNQKVRLTLMMRNYYKNDITIKDITNIQIKNEGYKLGNMTYENKQIRGNSYSIIGYLDINFTKEGVYYLWPSVINYTKSDNNTKIMAVLSDPDYLEIIVKNRPPKIDRMDYSRSSLNFDEINVTVNCSDEDGNISEVELSSDREGKIFGYTQLNNCYYWVHKFNSTGVYILTLNVKDDDGALSSQKTTVSIEDPTGLYKDLANKILFGGVLTIILLLINCCVQLIANEEKIVKYFKKSNLLAIILSIIAFMLLFVIPLFLLSKLFF